MTSLPFKNRGGESAASAGTIIYNPANGRVEYTSEGKFKGLAALVETPLTSSSTGVAGEFSFDDDYFYICTDTDTWKRTAIATF